MAGRNVGMSGHNFDAFVSSQRTFNDYDLAAKIQEKYWRARQKFLAKIEKKEDSCIVLSDSKLDAKLAIYRSIDKSCAKLTNILENYQNNLFLFANEENSLSILLKECSKHDKTKAGKILAVTGKSLTQSSHQRIKLYMPLMRLYQEMDTFHSRAVEDTSKTVEKLESKRSQYRASLLWMKDLSEKLDPDIYKQLDKFRRVQNQVRSDKKDFDSYQMDVVQKIDLLMASRCNLMNQILASYQAVLLETFERNNNNFRSIQEIIKKEDIYEYEFKTLKQLNPLQVNQLHLQSDEVEQSEPKLSNGDDNNNFNKIQEESSNLIDVSLEDEIAGESESKGCLIDAGNNDQEPQDVIEQLETLFGVSSSQDHAISDKGDPEQKKGGTKPKSFRANQMNLDLLNMDSEQQIASLLEPSENKSQYMASPDLDKLDDFLSWTDQNSNQAPTKPSTSSTFQENVPSSTNDLDLLGGLVDGKPLIEGDRNTSANIDLLTDLEDIDNSSYFKSFQRLQL